MNLQVDTDHYFNADYDSKERFISYWHQINEIITLTPSSIFEIGIGSGLVATYLKQRGYNVTTMDIDKGLNPDQVGSVLSIPFYDDAFEVIACFEVLEHLPFEDLAEALGEIYRVSSEYAVLSLPDSTKAYRLNIQIPKIGEFKRLVLLPRLRLLKQTFDGQHCWEIGYDYSLRKVTEEMRVAGFEIAKTYRVFEIPYHRFFVLRKNKVM